MPPGKWTEEELNFLYETYPSIEWTVGKIADYLERSEHSVTKKASILGLKKVKCSDIQTPKGHKVCRTCKIIKSYDNFYRNTTKDRAGDGYDSSCKSCVSEREKIKRREKKMKELEELVAQQEIIPKEKFIKANEGKLFKCSTCKELKSIHCYTVYMRNSKVQRGYKCKKCVNEATRERELEKLKKDGYL